MSNLAAFLRVIRAGETNQTDDAYRMMFGGALFDSFADHPRRAFKSKWGWTSAAGAYQAMCAVPGKVKTDTWGDFIRSQGPHDFSPASQDAFAVWCIKRRGALDDVIAGRFEDAIRKCAREWASLPFSPYGQPVKTLKQCRAVYEKFGGRYEALPTTDDVTSATSIDFTDQPASPAPAPTGYMRAGEFPQEPEMPLAPIIGAVLPSIIESIPKLGKLFGSGSEVAERNVKAAEMAVGIVKDAVGAVNAQDAAEKLSDPALRQVAAEAVEAHWYMLSHEVGGGIAAARTADAAYQAPDAKGFWHSPVFWVTLLLLPLVYTALYAVLFREGFSNDIKAMVIGAVFGGLLTGGIQSFFYGTSASSQKKTDMLGK